MCVLRRIFGWTSCLSSIKRQAGSLSHRKSRIDTIEAYPIGGEWVLHEDGQLILRLSLDFKVDGSGDLIGDDPVSVLL